MEDNIENKLDPKNNIFIKGFNKNLKSVFNNFQYEIGKTYKLIKGELKLRKNGFHASPSIDDVMIYSYYPDDSIYCLVKILGNTCWDVYKTQIVTDKIKIIKILTNIELIELNNNNEYIQYYLKYKLYKSNNERQIIFDKFIENCVHVNYLYQIIENDIIHNENERKIVNDKINELKLLKNK